MLRAQIFAEKVFLELIFASLAINRENNFQTLIEQMRKFVPHNIMIFQFKNTDFIKPSLNQKNE